MEKCQYCGANPVPHRIEWFYESLDILLGPLRRMILYSASGIFLQRILSGASKYIFFVFEKIGLVRYNTDFAKIKIGRAKVLWEEAVRRGLPIKEIRPFGLGIDGYRVKIGKKELTYFGLPRPGFGTNRALDWADDKWLFKKALLARGLPVAAGASVWNYRQALITFRAISKPVIVKPRTGSRGRHTTTFIYTERELKQAYKIAKQLCSWVIVEEHLRGPVWRGTVVNGKCVGVLGGDPPKVIGDGKSTIEQLIALANRNKHPLIKDIVINKKMREFLARSGVALETVLPAGELMELNEKVGISYGGSSFEAYEQAHSDILKMFEDAAAIIGDPILGFDFICDDIAKSWREQRCGIIECNGLPFIDLHHHPVYGTPRNVAKEVWDYVEGTVRG